MPPKILGSGAKPQFAFFLPTNLAEDPCFQEVMAIVSSWAVCQGKIKNRSLLGNLRLSYFVRENFRQFR